VLPVSPAVADVARRSAAGWPVQPIIVTDVAEKHDAYAAAGVALTKSGTSTLELALAGVPMAVAYRVNPLTAALARRMIQVPHVAMVNLLAGRPLVPELLQEECTAETLSRTVLALLRDAGLAQAQRDGFRAVLDTLRPPVGLPSEAAAREVRAWQGRVLELVQEQGQDKRATARALSFGVNGAGLAVMVAVFAQTGGLSGAEVAVAGGTSAVSQKVLEAVFGDAAVRALATHARQDLVERAGRLLAAERLRFTALVDAVVPAPDTAAGLRVALAGLAVSRRTP